MNNNVILLGVKNGAAVGKVVENLLAAGFAVEVTGEHIACTCRPGCPGTLLARIEFTKPVSAETRAAKKAWSEKLEAAKLPLERKPGVEAWKPVRTLPTLSEQLQAELEPLPGCGHPICIERGHCIGHRPNGEI